MCNFEKGKDIFKFLLTWESWSRGQDCQSRCFPPDLSAGSPAPPSGILHRNAPTNKSQERKTYITLFVSILFNPGFFPYLWRRPSQARESLDRQDHQARCPHFHCRCQGSKPNLLHKKQKSGCWDTTCSIMGNTSFFGLYDKLNKPAELLSYPRDTATALHPLCHPDCWPSRCSPFPLLQPLLG